jgi:LacI family transcriptional regulator
MAITLKELAKAVNLSPAAVSLVLNNRPNRISPEKKELILKVAKELDYVPNQNAVSLVKRKTKALGIVIPDIKNVFFSEIVSGIDKIALEREWNIMIMNTNDRCEMDFKDIQMLTSRNVDAMILTLASKANENVEQYRKLFEKFGKPVVLVDRIPNGLNTSTVKINHELGACLAIRHLYNMGHRHIAILSGPAYSSTDRINGIRKTCQELDIPLSEADIFEGDFTMNSGYMLADNIITGSYTAIFSLNDMMAYGLYKRFEELGVHVPDAISIIGFDDIFFSDCIGLTSIRQPAYNLGIEAARCAFHEIDHPDSEKRSIVFKPTLCIRNSVKTIFPNE